MVTTELMVESFKHVDKMKHVFPTVRGNLRRGRLQ